MLRKILNDSVFYGSLSGFSKISIFIVLPFVVRSMEPHVYGQVEMLLVFGVLLSVISITGTDSAFSYFYFKNSDDKEEFYSKNSVIISTIIWRLGASLAIICALLIFHNYILDFLHLEGDQYFSLYLIYANLLAQHLTSLGMDYYRFNRQKAYFGNIVILHSLSAAILMYALVVINGLSINGYFLSVFISNILAGSIFGVHLLKIVGRANQLTVRILPLLKFGTPLIPASIAMYGMTTLDRWFITKYVGAEELGKYAIAAKLAIVVTILVEAFRTAWWPIAMEYLHSPSDQEKIKIVSKYYLCFFGVVTFFVSLFSYPALRLFGGESYLGFHYLVAIVGLSSIIYGYAMISTLGIWVSEKTYLSAIISSVALVLGFILNVAFVPTFGVNGAIGSTLATYLFWIICGIVLGERHMSFGISANHVLIILLIIILFALLTSYVSRHLFVNFF